MLTPRYLLLFGRTQIEDVDVVVVDAQVDTGVGVGATAGPANDPPGGLSLALPVDTAPPASGVVDASTAAAAVVVSAVPTAATVGVSAVDADEAAKLQILKRCNPLLTFSILLNGVACHRTLSLSKLVLSRSIVRRCTITLCLPNLRRLLYASYISTLYELYYVLERKSNNPTFQNPDYCVHLLMACSLILCWPILCCAELCCVVP